MQCCTMHVFHNLSFKAILAVLNVIIFVGNHQADYSIRLF